MEQSIHTLQTCSVKVEKMNEKALIPTYSHEGDAGADVYSLESYIVRPGETIEVHTGIKVALPVGKALLILPKSGISRDTPLRIANSPGLLDSGYRGELIILIQNVGEHPHSIVAQQKIAQVLLIDYYKSNFELVDDVSSIPGDGRNDKGFGSSGLAHEVQR